MAAELRYCYNKGCGEKYKESENGDDACVFHPGPVCFHDAYKIWTCCEKKSTDFSTWLSIKGCARGRHNPNKPADDEPAKQAKPDPEVVAPPLPPEELVTWNGLLQPARRDSLPRVMTPITVEAPERVLELLKQVSDRPKETPMVKVGTACSNTGCNKVYEDEKSKEENCYYHPGEAVFHEGMKFWSCCQRKTSNFTNFMEQKGCVMDKTHCWIPKQVEDKIRYDYFARNGNIHLNIYVKGAVPKLCTAVSNGLLVRLKIVYAFGEKTVDLNFNLFAEVHVNDCKVIIGERKIETIMKQVEAAAWPRLTFEQEPDIIDRK